jgi:hypothetical protein
MARTRRFAVYAVTIGATCFVAVTSTAATASGEAAMAGPAGGTSNVSSGSFTAGQAAGADRYWTPARLAGAKPYVPTGRPAAGPAAVADTTTGTPTSVAPAAAPGAPAASPQPLAAASVPRPYTNLPDRLTVKIFFTKATGGNFVCSGTIVNSTTKRMVDTAGHCVSDGAGRFHLNFLVVPGYSSQCNGCGDAPFGRWTARTVTTTTEWHNFSNFKQDLGYIVTNDLNGQRIVNALGGHGSQFNLPRSQQWLAYGYPAAAPFNGFNQYVCPSGRLADDNPNPARPGPLAIRIACNMTGGSSGGGWIINQSTAGLGSVNGHNSYKYVSGPLANVNHMYSPYYGNEALSLFNFTVGLG